MTRSSYRHPDPKIASDALLLNSAVVQQMASQRASKCIPEEKAHQKMSHTISPPVSNSAATVQVLALKTLVEMINIEQIVIPIIKCAPI